MANDGHQVEICRAAYGASRDRGSPSVVVRNLYDDTYFAETTDGKARLESINKACCVWAIKFEIAQMWLNKHEMAQDGGEG